MTYLKALERLQRRLEYLREREDPNHYVKAEISALETVLQADTAQEVAHLQKIIAELRAENEDLKRTAALQTHEAREARKALEENVQEPEIT